MSTRLVERLEREIAHCQDPFGRECLKAPHAAVIARFGQLNQARRHGKPRLQARAHLVSGSVDYFSAAQSASVRVGFQSARDRAMEAGDGPLLVLLGLPEHSARHEEAARMALQALVDQQVRRRRLGGKLQQSLQEMGHPWPQD